MPARASTSIPRRRTIRTPGPDRRSSATSSSGFGSGRATSTSSWAESARAAFLALHVAIDGFDVDHVLVVNPAVFYLDAGANGSTADERAYHSAHTLTRGFVDWRRWKLAVRDREVRRRGLRSVRKLFAANAVSGFRVLAVGSARNAARRLGLHVQAPSRLAHDLADIIAHGKKVLLVFASGESSATYFRRFGGKECKTSRRRGGLDVINIDGGDHVFSPPASRRELANALTDYLDREYPE